MTRVIFTGANLVDGDQPPRPATVVVAADRIASVGDAPVDVSPDDRVIDLGGRTLMPGMIQSHFHAAYWNTGGSGKPIGLEETVPLQALRAAVNLKTALDCGFTSVISGGAPHAIDAALKRALAEGTIPGPRMMAGSRDVSTTGHSADMSFPSHWQIGAKGAISIANGPDEFRRAVRGEIKDGAEIIKIFATGGHATTGTGEDWAISADEFDAAIRAATERGVKTRAHIASREAILLAIRLGIHIVDHGDGLDHECVERLVETGTFITPSLFFPKVMMEVMAGNPWADALKSEFDAMAAILPDANAAGVKLLIGDDYGAAGLPHGRYGEELALYVNEIGIPAIDVIRWATKHGAEAMGMDSQIGTIEAGKLADLLVIDGDPVGDITILQDRTKLLAIMKGGEFVKDQLSVIAGDDRRA